jgi:segregation and condensation protein A
LIALDASTLELQTECFEGPLPVLLTLIKRNKVDIFDIPIGQIAEQFLAYVDLAREMDLKVAEDFIEMASLLIFIKSRMLLPFEGEDPREELVERIIEYEKLKAMAKSLADFPVLGRDAFGRGEVTEEEDEEDVFSLGVLFFQLMKSREAHFVTVAEIRPTLEEKLEEIERLLERDGQYAWKIDLAQELRERVATVLAMLEITKLKKAVISQRRPFGTILIKKR